MGYNIFNYVKYLSLYVLIFLPFISRFIYLLSYIIHSNATLIYASSLPHTISHIRNLFYNES